MRALVTETPTRTLTSDAQLIQDYLQSTGTLVNTANAGAGQVASIRNVEGQAEAIVIDPDGNVFHVCREPLSDSGWNTYGIGAGFQSLGAVDSATIWALGNYGSLWRSDHGRWTQASTLPGGTQATGLSVGIDGTVWATDSNTWLYVMGATSTQNPQVNTVIAPVLILDDGSLLNCFCADRSGALWTIRQRVIGGSWGQWINLGTPSLSVRATSFAVAANQNKRLFLEAFILSETRVSRVEGFRVGFAEQRRGRRRNHEPDHRARRPAASISSIDRHSMGTACSRLSETEGVGKDSPVGFGGVAHDGIFAARGN